MKRLLAGACAALLLAAEASGQVLGTAVPELFAHDDVPAGPSINTRLPVVARLVTPDGQLDFVLHRDGTVGIAATGTKLLRTVDALDQVFRASALEMHMALAPAGVPAPTALLQDHALRAQRQPRLVPAQPRHLPRGNQLAAVVGVAHSDGPEYRDPLCLNNWLPLWEYYVDPTDAGGGWSSYWDHHAWGAGSWYQGDANVSLGSSTAGRLMFCTPPNTEPQQGRTRRIRCRHGRRRLVRTPQRAARGSDVRPLPEARRYRLLHRPAAGCGKLLCRRLPQARLEGQLLRPHDGRRRAQSRDRFLCSEAVASRSLSFE